MKALLLTATVLVSSYASAQMPGHPPIQGHPPMAGHPVAAAPAGGVKEYRLPSDLFQVNQADRTAMPAPQRANEGTIVSTQMAGGYSYMEISGAEGKLWLAGPANNLPVGTRIRFEDGAVMSNFTSQSLKRTFETISFVGNVQPVVLNEGTVTEALAAGGYSYLEVTTTKGKEWLAVPMMQIKAGAKVRYEGGSVMHNFSSASLKRTFPSILFLGGVEVVSSN